MTGSRPARRCGSRYRQRESEIPLGWSSRPRLRQHDTIAKLRPLADEVVCVDIPPGLGAIGFYYTDFHQMSDDEVTAILARAAAAARGQDRG